MGFLKRLFSIGGKKHSKAKSSAKPEISSPMPASKRASKYYTAPAAPYSSSTPALLKVDEDPEVAVHRLLRSSSARWAVAHEVDHSDMPPMPHPINDVLSAYRSTSPDPAGYSTHHQTLSTASLTDACLSRGGSYSVKVYRKERLSSGPEEVLSNERKRKSRASAYLGANDSRTMKLHSEPSIVSLVSLYDDQGRLPDGAFSNDISHDSQPTPRRKKVPMPAQEEEDEEEDEIPKEGRAQTKRSGSTLRQLLGAATNGKSGDASEGDISWAERFLNEVDSVETTASSARSSFALPTPDSVRGHEFADVSIATSDMTVDNPAISSMDVELSISTTASRIFDDEEEPPVSAAEKTMKDSTVSDNTKTPTRRPLNLSTGHIPQKRASQVFNFIKKRASKVVEQQSGPDLPGPPKTLNSSASVLRRAESTQISEDQRTDLQATPRISSEKNGGIPAHSRDLASPGRRSSSTKHSDGPDRESGIHLTPRFAAFERAGGIPLYGGDMATPKPKKQQSNRIDSDGLENMGRMMLEELYPSRRSSEGADEQAESEREPETRAIPNLCATAVTPMRPAETEAQKNEREVRVLMTGPTKVIVTAPTPGTARHAEQIGHGLRRIPRGPRTQTARRRRTSGSDREERRRYRQERENAKRDLRTDKEKHHHHRSSSSISSTPQNKIAPRKYSHRSSSSVSSVASNENVHPNYGAVYAEAKRFVESSERHLAHMNKAKAGAGGGLGVKADIPTTPLRTSKRMSVNRETFQPPATGRGDAREERRKPRGERQSYALARSARV